jgi:hypothetical protein
METRTTAQKGSTPLVGERIRAANAWVSAPNSAGKIVGAN